MAVKIWEKWEHLKSVWEFQKPIVKVAKHGQTKMWYSRTGKPGTKKHRGNREYHLFSLVRVVTRVGSFYRLTFGKWCIAFGFKTNKGDWV